MINSKSKAFKNWMKILKDPKTRKATGALEDRDRPSARCCLGHACFVNMELLGITRKKDVSHVLYDSEASTLPKVLTDELRITEDGEFTDKGKVLVKKFLKDNSIYVASICHRECGTLAELNDHYRITPQRIGELIIKLARYEQRNKKDCFVNGEGSSNN